MQLLELTKILADRFGDNDEDEEAVRTAPVVVNAAAIRCFTPRKDARPGSRLTFTDGGGFAVTEPFSDIQAMLAGN